MTSFPFPDHTLDSAPDGSRRIMAAMAGQRGHVPAAVARLASSPQLLDGFLKASSLFESTSLDPVAREVVILTMATRNRCHICVAMHTAKLAALGGSPDLVAALREQRPLPDERLAAVQRFTPGRGGGGRGGRPRVAGGVPGSRVHRPQCLGRGARYRRVHHVDAGQPADRGAPGRAVQ
jgi:AhpD family alkylhydroperoxidase